MRLLFSLLGRGHLLLPLLAMIALVIAINTFALHYPLRIDLTNTGVYSIGPETLHVIKSIKKPVEIIFFYDLRSKAMTDSKALLEQYAQHSVHITVRGVDPALQPAISQRYNVRFAGTSVFQSENRQITVNGGMESDFTNGLIRISMQSAQKICFTDGHIESDPFSLKSHDHFEEDLKSGHNHSTGGRALELHERHGMGMAKDAMETLGYEISKVMTVVGPDQLDDCSVVVVSSPQTNFEQEEVKNLQRYLDSGGRMLLMLEPLVQSGLQPILDMFGISSEPGTVKDDTRHYWTDPATPAISEYPRHKITRNLALSFFPGAVSLVPAEGGPQRGVQVVKLIETSPDAWTESGSGDQRQQSEKSTKTLMVVAEKAIPESEDVAKLVVIGDGDFATNSYYHILGNGGLFLNVVNVLAGEEQLVDIAPRNYEIPKIRLTKKQMITTFVLSSVVFPLLLFCCGIIVWWRRK